MAAIQFTFSKVEGKHFATTAGTRFYIGTETVYQGRHGLFNYKLSDGPVYKPEDYDAAFGHWAWFIAPTAECESKGSFHCLNTYDRAAFTFTFMQFAAHVPEGDFVIFFRRLLQLPEAKDYFPFLELRDGRIWYARNGGASQLETSGSTQALMNYLNSDPNSVDNQELITSARFIHWAQNRQSHRDIQVLTAMDLFKENMLEHGTRFNLDGWPDYICQVICDIFHQGRAKYALVHEILLSTNNRDTIYTKLLNIGAGAYPDRIRTLKAVHKTLRDTGRFVKVYDAGVRDFV